MNTVLTPSPVPSPPGAALSPPGPPEGAVLSPPGPPEGAVAQFPTSEGAAGQSPPPEGARVGLGGEIAFGLTLVGIVATLLFELAKNALSFLIFLLRRNRHRERVRKLILTAAALLVLLAPGCKLRQVANESRAPSEGKGSPTSFRRQMYETRWSIVALADQSDAPRSLEEDLKALGHDPKWKENLLFDVRHLFLMPDARRSLEEDLKALADPDHKRHGLRETLEMFGW